MSDTSSIPSISYAIRQSMDRLKYQHDIYNQEFKERLKLLMGHSDYIPLPSYGIVSPTNPASTLAGSGDPLAVASNATDPLLVDVNPGMAVNQNGQWVQLNNYVRQRPLANPAVGVVNVVYLRYITISALPEINDYFQEVIPYTTRPGGLENPPTIQQGSEDSSQVYIETLDVYLNYSPDIRMGFVPVAIVTMQSVQDPVSGVVTSQLSIDHTQDNYSWNRPWFSANDMAHRALLGTGVQSPTNPHAQSQNDLTVGNFTPLQLQLDHGMIVADDQSLPKAPGFRCQVSIPYASILSDDASGTYTGFPTKKYISLPNYPVRLGKVWVESTGENLAALIVPETNRIVFASDGPPVNESVGVYYTRVMACEPPVGNNEISYVTNNPTTNELIIAGGIGHVNLMSTTEAFSDAQKFPMDYELVVDQDGDIIKTPQVIYCYKKLTAIGTSDTFSITQYGHARLMVGLTGAADVATMSIKIRVYGKDVAGASINHLFEFDGPTWIDPGPIPNTLVTAASLKHTSIVFASVDQLAIEERISDGPDSAIMIWANLDPFDTYDQLKDACHIASVMWDGLRLHAVRDKRIIGTTVRDFLSLSQGGEALAYLAHVLSGNNQTVYFDDFRNPHLHNLVPTKDLRTAGVYWWAAPANNFSKLRVGALGYYCTRALPVNSGSGARWRVVVIPFMERRTPFYYPPGEPPEFLYYDGIWHQDTMTAVAGLRGTYEYVIPSGMTPTRVSVEIMSPEYSGFVLFG